MSEARSPQGKLAATESEWKIRLRSRSCGGDGWRACGKLETRQEGSDDLGVGDHGNNRALSRASGTLQNVKLEHPTLFATLCPAACKLRDVARVVPTANKLTAE